MKEHLENNKAFASYGRCVKVLAMVAKQLGMEAACGFLPAHSLILLTCTGSNPFAVTPWPKFLTCAILALVLGILSAVSTPRTHNVRLGGYSAQIISRL